MSRIYNLLSTTFRPFVTQIKRHPQTLRRPFALFVSSRPPETEATSVMCLHNNRRFRTRVRFALGGTALFIRTSLEKAGFWRPLLKFLSSFVGVTAARLIGVSPFRAHRSRRSICMADADDPVDGVAVLTAGFLVLDSGLTMLEAQGVPREHLDTESESESCNESVDSRLFNKTVEVYESFFITII